jgi:hypothetical protein
VHLRRHRAEEAGEDQDDEEDSRRGRPTLQARSEHETIILRWC